MKRYTGQDIGERPHLAVLGACKVGNFVAYTPLLRGIKEKWPESVLDFIGTEITKDFEEEIEHIDWRVSWDDASPGAGLKLQQEFAKRIDEQGDYDLVVNLDGYNPVTCTLVPWLSPRYFAGGSLDSNLRRPMPVGDHPIHRILEDKDWNSSEFLERNRKHLISNYIAELFCRTVFIETDYNKIVLPSKTPSFEVPDILIHCTTTRTAKFWSFANWRVLIKQCSSWGYSVGIVGSPPSLQKSLYFSGGHEESLFDGTDLIDLRGKTSLIELAGACRQAKAMVTLDAGPMHIAAAVGCKTIVVVGNDETGVGASPVRLWMPRSEHIFPTVSTNSCQECQNRRFRNIECVVEGQPCMQGVSTKSVIDLLSSVLNPKEEN